MTIALWILGLAGFGHLNYAFEKEANEMDHSFWENPWLPWHCAAAVIAVIGGYIFVTTGGSHWLVVGGYGLYIVSACVANAIKTNIPTGVFGTLLQMTVITAFSLLVLLILALIVGAAGGNRRR